MYFMHRPAISIDVGNGQQRSKMMNSLILEDWTRRRIGEQEVTGLATQPTRIQPDLSTWLAPTGRPSPPAYPTLPWRRNLLSRWVWGSKRSATPRCLLLAFIASCTLTVVYSQLLDCNNDAAASRALCAFVKTWKVTADQFLLFAGMEHGRLGSLFLDSQFPSGMHLLTDRCSSY
jgi:hypothetical protein